MSEGIWEQLEPLLTSVERPSRYCNHEWGTILNTEADYRCALIYPDTYEIGQSNQGLAILYRILNADPTIAAERAYVPWIDMASIMRERGIPLFSLETYTPLSDFDLLGFTLPHELACTNVLEALDLARLPMLASERDENCPLIIAGGPCVYNPEPFVPFFDAFVIGEGEDVILEIVNTHRRLRDGNATREELLLALAHIDGVYVPRFYEENEGTVVPLIPDLPAIIYKRVMRDFAERPADIEQIVPFAEVTHDRFTIEVLRGCSRGCRFCQAGMTYRPVRERTSDSIVSAVLQGLACTGYDEASLTSLSTTDHSQIEDILQRLNRRLESTGISISIPSQRVDAFGVDIAQLVAGEKKGGLTFAPEAGTQRLRDIINKNITEEDLLTAISSAFSAGWRRLKLYFMCGLPGETDEDLIGMGKLVRRAYETAKDSVPNRERGNVRMSVSCALFVPKPHTPFQWCGQIPSEEIERRIALIRGAMPGKGVDFHWHDSSTSFVESTVARGGREMGAVIAYAWENGARFDAWREHFSLATWMDAANKAGVSLEEISARSFDLSDHLPWEHISTGVSPEFMKNEYRKALEAQTTPDCTFSSCTDCGVCPTLDCGIVLGGGARG